MTAVEARHSEQHFTADELATLANVPRRTLRYYIQLGLVDRPVGETRAAYYTRQHLKRLLEIREYTDQGFSLERVSELLSRNAEAPSAASAPRAGSISVQSHIYLADGVQLVVEPGQARLTPEQLRRFARAAIEAYARIADDEQD